MYILKYPAVVQSDLRHRELYIYTIHTLKGEYPAVGSEHCAGSQCIGGDAYALKTV